MKFQRVCIRIDRDIPSGRKEGAGRCVGRMLVLYYYTRNNNASKMLYFPISVCSRHLGFISTPGCWLTLCYWGSAVAASLPKTRGHAVDDASIKGKKNSGELSCASCQCALPIDGGMTVDWSLQFLFNLFNQVCILGFKMGKRSSLSMFLQRV